MRNVVCGALPLHTTSSISINRGKLQILGTGTAIKVLLLSHSSSDVPLSRQEIIALMNTLHQLMKSIDFASRVLNPSASSSSESSTEDFRIMGDDSSDGLFVMRRKEIPQHREGDDLQQKSYLSPRLITLTYAVSSLGFLVLAVFIRWRRAVRQVT